MTTITKRDIRITVKPKIYEILAWEGIGLELPNTNYLDR